jgi:hypothetical protein
MPGRFRVPRPIIVRPMLMATRWYSKLDKKIYQEMKHGEEGSKEDDEEAKDLTR